MLKTLFALALAVPAATNDWYGHFDKVLKGRISLTNKPESKANIEVQRWQPVKWRPIYNEQGDVIKAEPVAWNWVTTQEVGTDGKPYDFTADDQEKIRFRVKGFSHVSTSNHGKGETGVCWKDPG